MNFNITEEQQLLMESIQQFMERYAPESEVKKWYENHHVPTEVSKAFVEAGFGFLGVPEEYGGTPCDMVTLMMFAKEISRLTAGTMPFMSNILNMYDMLLLGTPEQIKMALDSYVETGESCFSLAISEPQAGSDNSSMTTIAKRVGDKIILNGTKTFVTHGDVSPMTIIVAKEEDPSRENKRMSMYMVPLNTKGISTSRLHKIGQGTTAFCEMYIDNVECDDSCLVGECGKGFLQLMQNFEIERLLICAQALGLAEAAMEDAAKYAAQRVQFNQPIYKFQQIQHMLIAGTTGSGKTIFLYSIIVSLLHKYPMEDLEFLIIDPKQTDFVFFEDLPNLYGGHVVVDAEEALEMIQRINDVDKEGRMQQLRFCRSRDIGSYNEKNPDHRMKRLIIIIDEYADLIQTAEMQGKRKEFEKFLSMLAQKVRSLGIHLIIATQRPSANIVTGVLKANIPYRISFRLPSHTDSQTILDMPGAENLLGKGDMLMVTDSDTIRMQGLYISEDELDNFVKSRQ